MSFNVEKDIMVPMRDGVRLATDAWIPSGDGPHPVLLVRLPYSKDMTTLYAYGLAVNRVFHGPGRPSRLWLPVIDR